MAIDHSDLSTPELQELHNLQQNFALEVVATDSSKDHMIGVCFQALDKQWHLFIEDEFNDFHPENQLMCLFLVLKALEDYNDEPDFLAWTNYHSLNPADPFWLQYYRDFGPIYDEIATTIGPIDPMISDLDYQLGSGVMYALRNQ